MCFIHFTKAYDSVNRTHLWKVLAGMLACVCLDHGELLGWFPVEQDLPPDCVLSSILFNIFFTAVLQVALTSFEGQKGAIDVLVNLRKKTRARG